MVADHRRIKWRRNNPSVMATKNCKELEDVFVTVVLNEINPRQTIVKEIMKMTIGRGHICGPWCRKGRVDDERVRYETLSPRSQNYLHGGYNHTTCRPS
ncbi:hypothetical protein SUGI_1007160 [Cryptomeria japonica]|nr:hypothetical protein SUGI_1007160 [Cryptomeria japonica]